MEDREVDQAEVGVYREAEVVAAVVQAQAVEAGQAPVALQLAVEVQDLMIRVQLLQVFT